MAAAVGGVGTYGAVQAWAEVGVTGPVRVAAAIPLASPTTPPQTPTVSARPPRETPTSAALGAYSDRITRAEARERQGRPRALSLPTISETLPVAPVALDDAGRMAVPPDPQIAGWYRWGATPESDTGSVVLAAHVDGPSGPGPLMELGRLEPGDPVHVVTSAGRTHTYRIRTVERHAKATLDPAWVFDKGGAQRLHIVSCGGRWDARASSYTDNVIAIAEPAPQR